MGKVKFLAIFFFSLLSGSIASALFLQGASIGASGAAPAAATGGTVQ
jgi:membrane associated rhomboid family serine protease